MVYKKYITRGGKKFGPYYYESYRDKDGKVRTRYVSGPHDTLGISKINEKKPSRVTSRKVYGIITVLLLIIILLSAFVFLKPQDTVIRASNIGTGIFQFTSEIYSAISGFITDVGNESPEEVVEPAQEPTPAEPPPEPVEEPTNVTEPAEPVNETAPMPEEPTNITEPINETIPAPAENITNITEPTPTNITNVTEQNITQPPEENVTPVEAPPENITAPSEPIPEPTNITPVENVTITNVTVIDLIENITTSLETRQYGAVLGKPVRWTKKVIIENAPQTINASIAVELPSLAGNVSVKKLNKATGEEVELQKEAGKVITEVAPIVEVPSNPIAVFFRTLINGILSITGKVVDILTGTEEVVVEIDEEVDEDTEFEIEYYTDAPFAEERDLSDSSKEVKIIGPDEVHYENVLAFSYLPKEVTSPSNIKLRWIVNGTPQDASFTAYDTDGNQLLDYIEWVVPILSEQTYEIIVITKAQHLDENRVLVNNIYEQVKALDGNWSEPIPVGHYVRVTFEKNLTSERDITVYARSSGSSQIEIYEAGMNEIVATSEDITSEKSYKTLLTGLSGSQDTFDLKVIGDSIEIDWIVDPICPGAMAGAGTESSACQITNCTQLQAVNESVALNYTLINGIDFDTDSGCSQFTSGAGFVPIGNSGTPFTGTFEGNGLTINGLFINRALTDQGLFGQTSGTIRDLFLTDANVSGSTSTGILMGVNLGTAINVHTSGNVTTTGTVQVGGVAGRSTATSIFQNSSSSATVFNAFGYVGGFVGDGNGIFDACFASGDVSGAANFVGGFVGLHRQTSVIDNSYARGDVFTTGGDIGGFVGNQKNTALINNSYSTGNVSGSGADVGGFWGRNEGGASFVENSFSVGNVSGSSTVGGFAGSAGTNKITNSFYNNISQNPDFCIASGTGDCNAINDNLAYFFDVNNAPMDKWDFTNTWSDTNNGTSFPILKWQEANTPPIITLVTLNSTSNNQTGDNLTGFVTANDADGDNITLDFNWYKTNSTGTFLEATTLINDESLVLYLPFNNDSLDYKLSNDASLGNGSAGTEPSFNITDGQVGSAFTFDGVDDSMNISDNDSLDFGGEITIAFLQNEHLGIIYSSLAYF